MSLVRVSLGLFDFGNGEADRGADEDRMRRVSNLEKNFMRTGLQADNNDRIAACMRPGTMPVIDRYMKMAKSWRDLSSGFAEYRDDSYVLGPILNDDDAASQRGRKRWIRDELGSGL